MVWIERVVPFSSYCDLPPYTPSGHLGTQGIHHKKLDSIKSYFPTFRNPYDRVSFTPVPPLVTLVSRRRRDTRE